MSAYRTEYPIPVGSRKNFTAAQLAERAMDCVASLPAKLKGQRRSYGLMIGPDGKATIDVSERVNVRDWVATITRTSDPDWLADEIREVLP